MALRSNRQRAAGELLAGAVLALVGNALYPRYSNLDDVTVYRRVASNAPWLPANFVLLVSFLLLVAGTLTFVSVLEERGAEELARLGRTALTIQRTGDRLASG